MFPPAFVGVSWSTNGPVPVTEQRGRVGSDITSGQCPRATAAGIGDDGTIETAATNGIPNCLYIDASSGFLGMVNATNAHVYGTLALTGRLTASTCLGFIGKSNLGFLRRHDCCQRHQRKLGVPPKRFRRDVRRHANTLHRTFGSALGGYMAKHRDHAFQSRSFPAALRPSEAPNPSVHESYRRPRRSVPGIGSSRESGQVASLSCYQKDAT
jgi:hypothetical protein